MTRSAMAFFLFATTSMHAAGSPPCPVDALDWMTGHWRHCDAAGCTQEHWLAARDGRMLGVNQQWGERDAFEFLRIQVQDGAVVYIAQPGGGPATTFVMSQCLDREVHFTNAANDFPRRIVYRAEGGDVLTARIDGGSHAAMTWRWQRVGAD